MLEAATVMLLLHGLNGRAILVNPAAIASMQASVEGQKNALLTEQVRCVINTNDGKFVSVLETCDEVRNQMGQQ